MMRTSHPIECDCDSCSTMRITYVLTRALQFDEITSKDYERALLILVHTLTMEEL